MSEKREGRGSPERKKPRSGQASGLLENNVKTSKESNVMSKNTTAVSNVIPFSFEKREVRTLLIDDQPWFVAADVCKSLGIANTTQALQALDEDERSMFNIGRQGEANIVNESGLYTLILRSREATTPGTPQHRFRKWVTAEVLPAIRKHGRYEDTSNTMATLIGETIGTNGFNMLGALIKGKVTSLPTTMQRKATAKIWSQTHAAFGVRSAADIPASQIDAARNFIAAYALEGEWLGREEAVPQCPLNIHFPVEAIACRRADMLKSRDGGGAWLDVSLNDLPDTFRSPCEMILAELRRAGYEVEGAWWELRTYRNKIGEFVSAAKGLARIADDPQRYAIKPRAAV